MSIKLRVYEVAKDLGVENKVLVALLQAAGVPDVKNHMSAVSPEGVERVKRHLEKQKQPSVVEERIRPTVVKRRAVVREPSVLLSPPPSRPRRCPRIVKSRSDSTKSPPVRCSSLPRSRRPWCTFANVRSRRRRRPLRRPWSKRRAAWNRSRRPA
ncbi:MAG: translation initiation factor IF-2 N-terminal domain-containing protein [Pseudomonadota bacterium]